MVEMTGDGRVREESRAIRFRLEFKILKIWTDCEWERLTRVG